MISLNQSNASMNQFILIIDNSLVYASRTIQLLNVRNALHDL